MIIDLLKSKLHSKSMVTFLIALNVSIWLAITVIRIFLILFNIDFYALLTLVELPSDPRQFAYTPWTILTYCFIHTGFFHILFNMLALHWFGHIAEEHFSSRQILVIYLLGGVAGGALFMTSFNSLPYFVEHFSQTYLLGASASVLAIVTAAAYANPSYPLRFLFIGEVKLKWLALIMIIVSFLGVTGTNAGGDIAHLGGAAFGILYAYIHKFLSKRRNIFSRHARTRKTPKMADFHFQRGTRDTTEPSNTEVDDILDKIKRTGYASLTDDEKQRLFRH